MTTKQQQLYNALSRELGASENDLLNEFIKELNKGLNKEKKYILLGSNNFWYSVCDNLKEARQLKKEILTDTGNSLYGDPESNYSPEPPNDIYIYEATEK